MSKIALASLPLARAFGAINSRIGGVQLGAITYSFRNMALDDIVKAYVDIGLGEMELMSNHCEALAGAPSGRGGGGRRGQPMTPEQQAARDAAVKALADFRKNATEATFAPVRLGVQAPDQIAPVQNRQAKVAIASLWRGRVGLDPVVEPIVLRFEADQDTSGSAVAGDDDFLISCQP